MEIKAVRERAGAPYTLTLEGAPQGTVVEVRMTNTMNGVQSVHAGEVKDGTLLIPTPLDFGQHINFEARVLTATEADKVIPFHFEDDGAQRDGNAFTLVASGEGVVPAANPVSAVRDVTADEDIQH